jgi:uracil-DNA glycosylase family 4
VSDPLRRYLQLQRDIGGDEIIFDAPVDVRAALSASAPPAIPSPAERATPIAPVVRETRVPDRLPLSGQESAAAPAAKGAPPIPGPGLTIVTEPAPGASAWTSLEQIADIVRACRKCPLCETRTHAVPGEGDPAARLMLVGEGPGESEDLSGRPFVGRAGDLLNKMLEAIAIPRADAFIANVVKCRPPKNRVPLPDEREACRPYLHRQIALVQPRVLLALGGTAAEAMLGVKKSLGGLRLQVHTWNGIPLIVTYHPAALLRNPDWKRPAWDDLRIVRQLLDRNT